MKILITGTFCSGKTSLSKLLSSTLQGSHFVDEPARELVTNIPNIDWSLKEVRNYLIVRQVVSEKIAEFQNLIAIIDAGIESNIAHDELLHPAVVNYSLPEKINHTRYDFVFFCNHKEIQFENDGFRMSNLEFRDKLADQILIVLKRLAYEPIILSGSLLERAKIVKEIIGYESS